MTIEAGTTRITAFEYAMLAALVQNHVDHLDAAVKRVGDPDGVWAAARPTYQTLLDKIDVLGMWAAGKDVAEAVTA